MMKDVRRPALALHARLNYSRLLGPGTAGALGRGTGVHARVQTHVTVRTIYVKTSSFVSQCLCKNQWLRCKIDKYTNMSVLYLKKEAPCEPQSKAALCSSNAMM